MSKSNSTLLENNINNLKAKLYQQKKDEKSFYELILLADKLVSIYENHYYLKDDRLDEIINEYTDFIKKSKQDNKDAKKIKSSDLLYYDKDNFKKIYNQLDIREKKLMYNTFNNNINFENSKIKLNFNLNKKRQAIFNEAKYKKADNSTIDLRGTLQYSTLEEISDFFEKHGLLGVKKFIDDKKEELEYKKDILKDLKDYIMYSIMNNSQDIHGAKVAIIFGLHFDANLKTPIKYAFNSTDKNNINIINLYKQLYKEDLKCYLDYFEEQRKNPLYKKDIPISKINNSVNETKSTKKR